MRIALPLGRTLFFLCFFLFSLVGLFPLRIAIDRLALEDRGFAAREADGSVWLGALREAQFGSIPLGDLQASLGTFPLILGRARVDLTRREETGRFEGAVTVSRHSFAINDLSARLDLRSALAPLPIGSLDLSGLSAGFADGLCVSAEGMVKAGIAADVAGMPLAGGLSGNARCEGSALLLPLASQTGMEALNLRLFSDGRYQVELAVNSSDAGMRARLAAAGFAPGANDVFLLRRQGKL